MSQFSFNLLSGIEPEELLFLEELTRSFSPEKKNKFIVLYQGRRKDPQSILIFALLGFVAIAGIHRFVLNQVGMGLIYLFTGGFCGIGTIVDAVNHKRLAWDFNRKEAALCATMLENER